MRYMIIVKATPDSEADIMPSAEAMETMGRFNDELIKAGVLLAAEALRSTRFGSLVTYRNGAFTVKDGPFTEAKEAIAGFWIIDVKSYDEALAWVKRIPFDEGETIEVRKIFEASDWAAEGIDPELIEREQAQRAQADQR